MGRTGDDRSALKKLSCGDSNVLQLRVHTSTPATTKQPKITCPERGVSAAYFLSARDFPLDMLIRFSILWLHYEQTKHTRKSANRFGLGRRQFSPGYLPHDWCVEGHDSQATG